MRSIALAAGSWESELSDGAADGGIGLGSRRGVRSVADPASARGTVRPVVRAAAGLEGAVRAWDEYGSDGEEGILAWDNLRENE